MCGHPLEVTLKLNVSVVKKKNQTFVKFNFDSGFFAPALKQRRNSVYGRELSSHLEKAEAQIVYIFTPVLFLLCRRLHCSLRCVTYGKQ